LTLLLNNFRRVLLFFVCPPGRVSASAPFCGRSAAVVQHVSFERADTALKTKT
jgi:hypothetical protein